MVLFEALQSPRCFSKLVHFMYIWGARILHFSRFVTAGIKPCFHISVIGFGPLKGNPTLLDVIASKRALMPNSKIWLKSGFLVLFL